MRNSRLRCSLCSCGRVHSADSATNETTSTIAAAQLNSHTGIGRSALPTIPCASAAAGNRRAAAHGAMDRNREQPPGRLHCEGESRRSGPPVSLFAGPPDAPQSWCSGAGPHRQHPGRGVAPVSWLRWSPLPARAADDAQPGTGGGAGDGQGAARRTNRRGDPRALGAAAPQRALEQPRTDLLAPRPRGHLQPAELAERLGRRPRDRRTTLLDELEELGYLERDRGRRPRCG